MQWYLAADDSPAEVETSMPSPSCGERRNSFHEENVRSYPLSYTAAITYMSSTGSGHSSVHTYVHINYITCVHSCMTMSELLTQLIKRAKTEGVESLRQYIGALNGLGGIYSLQEKVPTYVYS